TLEEAFIAYLEDAIRDDASAATAAAALPPPARQDPAPRQAAERQGGFLLALRRLLSCARREQTELRRDPIRLTLAALGSLILMIVIGYGINLDVEDLRFAVLDHDQTSLSRDYALALSGSR